MKLDLTKTPIVPADTEAEFQSAFDIIEETKADMEKLGLSEYPRPKSAPISLAEIGEIDRLTNPQLGALYVQYVAYAQYINTKLTDTIVGYKIAVNNLKHITAELTSRLHAKAIAKAEVTALVRRDPLYQRADAELVKFFAMKTLLEAHHKAYDKQASALSRMISLRELEFQQSLRQEGIAKPRTRQRLTSEANLR
jgi:hypothetical protein